MTETTSRGLGGVIADATPGLLSAAVAALAMLVGGHATGLLSVLGLLLLPLGFLSWLAASARRRLEDDGDAYVRAVVGVSMTAVFALLGLLVPGRAAQGEYAPQSARGDDVRDRRVRHDLRRGTVGGAHRIGARFMVEVEWLEASSRARASRFSC